MSGQLIKGFEILEEIGQGGFGVVYRAHQARINRDVAIKVILPEYANDSDFRVQFNHEAEMIGRLEHPHIVPLYDYWHDQTGAYLVMRWMSGGSLKSRLKGTIDLNTTKLWFEQIAHALDSAHRNGVIHRDVKSANILLDEDENVYLADFGIAKDITLHNSQSQNPLTPSYAAPEQFTSEPITPTTDIYALGIMLYEILTGELPFQGSLTELVFQHINAKVPSIHAQFSEIPATVDRVLEKATAKAPEDRFQSVITMYEAFKQAIDSPQNHAYTTTTATNAITNPFFHRGPIRDSGYFFGQENETRQLLSLLHTGQSVSIIGQRRIGKTSILYHMMDEAVLSQHNLQVDQYLMIYLDCGALISLEQDQIYLALLEEMADSLYEKGQEDVDLTGKFSNKLPSYRAFERSLRDVLRGDWRLVFILDEFELFSQNPNLESEFFTGLRALAMRHPVTYVTASKQPLLDLTYADASALSSPFFNIFATIHLSSFSDEQAHILLSTLVQHTSARFSDEQINHMISIAGGIPLFLQIAGYHALEILLTNGTIEPSRLEQQFRDDVLAHLEYYWRSLGEAEQHALVTLPVSAQRQPAIIHQLQQSGLIRKDDSGNYYPFSPIFWDFIRSKSIEEVLQAGDVIIDEKRHEVICHGEAIDLSPLQYDLLCVFVTQPEQVLSNEVLERELWQDDYVDDPERLKSVIKGLRRSLGNYAEHIENQRGVGYKWRVNL